MKKENFKKYLKEKLPIIFDQGIVTEDRFENSYNWYSSHIGDVRDNSPIFFYDWIILAMDGCQKAQAFVDYCQNIFVGLLSEKAFDEKIRNKIWASIHTPAKHPSYMDSLGELILLYHLLKESKKDGYIFLGTDFDIGNGRNADIAFEKDNIIRLIEISNFHYLKGKDLIGELRKRCENKLSKKTKEKKQIDDFYKAKYPYKECHIIIAIFVWEETNDIKGTPEDLTDLLNEKKDDMLPPVTLLCLKDENGEFTWLTSPLSYALELWQVRS